jgi:hypothetical protein
MRTEIYLLMNKRLLMRKSLLPVRLCLMLWLPIFCGIGLFCGTGVIAQSYVGQIEYRKNRQAAATVRLPYNADPVENGLKEYMSIKGFKESSASGLIVFRGVPLDPSDTDRSDLYFSTDAASRNEKNVTLLNLLALKRNQDLMVRTQFDSARIDKARLFLDSLAPFIDAFNSKLQINSRQEGLQKAQKKMNSLINDQADLEKRLRRLQSDLDQNKTDQIKAAADLQANINGPDDIKRKSQKKLNGLIDDQGSLEKKIRKAQLELDENKSSQKQQQEEIGKQQQGLDAIKARQNA